MGLTHIFTNIPAGLGGWGQGFPDEIASAFFKFA